MVTVEKYTHEDMLRRSFETNPQDVGRLLQAPDDAVWQMQWTQEFSVPAKYAKAILLEWLTAQLKDQKP